MVDKVEAPKHVVKPPIHNEAPWVMIYNDFYVLQTTHGCLVKVEGNVTFMPNATCDSFYPIELYVK